jgi:hypothetical protein
MPEKSKKKKFAAVGPQSFQSSLQAFQKEQGKAIPFDTSIPVQG